MLLPPARLTTAFRHAERLDMCLGENVSHFNENKCTLDSEQTNTIQEGGIFAIFVFFLS